MALCLGVFESACPCAERGLLHGARSLGHWLQTQTICWSDLLFPTFSIAFSEIGNISQNINQTRSMVFLAECPYRRDREQNE